MAYFTTDANNFSQCYFKNNSIQKQLFAPSDFLQMWRREIVGRTVNKEKGENWMICSSRNCSKSFGKIIQLFVRLFYQYHFTPDGAFVSEPM